MYVKSFLLAVGLLAVAGCVGNVSVPPPGPDHPASPRAAAAPLPSPTAIPASGKRVGTMGGMRGMDYGAMKGMDHGSMHNAPAMKGMKKMEKKRNMGDTEGMHHVH